MSNELRRPAKPSCGASKNTRSQGLFGEKGIKVGQMRNGNVEGNRAGAGGPHEGTAARILARTAQAWEVK